MCITFLFRNPGENPGDNLLKYKLVLINNRDEFYGRETQNATLFVEGDLRSIFGIDLAGAVKGTWLGISERNGVIRVGNLANVTGDDVHGKIGRGPIVTNWIKGDETIEVYNEKLADISNQFSSFNFLSVDINQNEAIKTFYISNAPKTLEPLFEQSYIGLGNSPLSSPFKKVEAGTEKFKEILESHKESAKEDLIEILLSLLKDETKFFPDDELTSRKQETAERFSSIHIDLSELDYGTRTRTVILVDNDNNVDYIEETMTSSQLGVWERTHLKIPKFSSQL